MVSIPESPTKRQENIVPSTYEQALTLLNEKDERIEQLEIFIAQQGLTFHAEAIDLPISQTNDREGMPRTLFDLAIRLNSTLLEIVADQDVKIEVANEDAELKQTYVENLNAQIDRAYTTIDKYEREKIYEYDLFSNPDLGSSEKLVLLASRNVIRELRPDDDVSLTDFHLNTIANQTGLTSETVGKKLQRLDKVFNTVEYRPKKVYAGKDKQGKSLFVSDTKLAILPLADQPQAIQLPDEAPRHGGIREKKVCPQCGSDKIQRTTHTCCLECKHTLELTIHMVNEETQGVEQSEADALYMLNEAVENALPTTHEEVPPVEQQCTCPHTSENNHDAIEETSLVTIENHHDVIEIETPEYKPAWKCDCRDAYKGWYWSRSVKLWRCTGCHKDASETREKAVL